MSVPNRKRYGVGAAIALLMLGATGLGYQLFRGRESGAGPVPRHAFYTDDNGKTFFRDDISKLPPFDHNGKQALRCDVFQDSNGKQFVGLLYRLTDNGRREMEAYWKNRSSDPDGSTRRAIEERGLQVKAPADKTWGYNDEATNAHLQAAAKDSAGKPAKLVSPD
jgi:hypothetical protein